MTKNSRRRTAKKTVAKNAVKANQLKLQKRAQTENVTVMLDKGLGLVYSVGVSIPSGEDAVSEILQRSSRHNRYQTIPSKRGVMQVSLKSC
jgi:cobalamin biosynthesis protein CbiD